jgi:hypothetical protein
VFHQELLTIPTKFQIVNLSNWWPAKFKITILTGWWLLRGSRPVKIQIALFAGWRPATFEVMCLVLGKRPAKF